MIPAKFIRRRPRCGARWTEDEMADLKAMLTLQTSLSDIAYVFYRSENAIVIRIAQNKLSYLARHISEVDKYWQTVQKFAEKARRKKS